MTPTALHMDLADQIARVIHEEGLKAGDRLNENRLAELLHVSRTPVRAALEFMAAQGFVERKANRGVELLRVPPLPPPLADTEEKHDEFVLRIARDRQEGGLANYVSEKDLMECYELSRPVLKEVLERLADLGVVERTPGYGWRFLDDVWGTSARQESYLFRMVIEPEAIRQPGFALTPGWADHMRVRHQEFMRTPWAESSSIAFFEMNAAFHEGLAAASGNRFFLATVQRQNRLRRLTNYNWVLGAERVQVNCREHLEMLERLEVGDTEMAALLMRRHLDAARQLRSSAASRD